MRSTRFTPPLAATLTSHPARLTLPQWQSLTADDWNDLPVDATSAYEFTFTYDAAGNRATQSDVDTGAIVTNTYDAGNRLVTSEDDSGITTYTYDANGNLLATEQPNGDVTTNTWDSENRLASVEHPDASIVTYAYNAEGHRVLKDDGVEFLRFVYDGNNVLQEVDEFDAVQAEFTYVPQTYAQLISQHRDAAASFYHFDGIHNTRALTDSSETVTDEYVFNAWGQSRSSSGSTANAHTYKGEFLAYYHDPQAGPESSLYSVGPRLYGAATARFTSADPAEDDLNLYRYVGNNPVNGVDPSGLESTRNRGRPPRNWPRQYAAPSRSDTRQTLVLTPRSGDTPARFRLRSEDEIAEMRKDLLDVNPTTGRPFPVRYPIELFHISDSGLSARDSDPRRDGSGDYILVDDRPWEITADEKQALIDAVNRHYIVGPVATLFFGASTLDEVVTGIVAKARHYRNARAYALGQGDIGEASGREFRKAQTAITREAIASEAAPVFRAVDSWTALTGLTVAVTRGLKALPRGRTRPRRPRLRAAENFVAPARSGIGEPVLFGQKRVGPSFSHDPRFPHTSGRRIDDVVADLLDPSNPLSPDDLPITAFRHPDTGVLVSANTGTRATLAKAGLEPTKVDIVDLNALSRSERSKLLRRLRETPIIDNAPLPGPRVPVTPSQRDLTVLEIIEIMGQ